MTNKDGNCRRIRMAIGLLGSPGELQEEEMGSRLALLREEKSERIE